ncbi:hypothetical protein V8D89_001639 [Ganoderma adspersum]
MSSLASGIPPSSLGTPSLNNTFGALLLSTFVSVMLYGVTLAQTIRYSRLYPSDRLLLKCLVFAILYRSSSTTCFSFTFMLTLGHHPSLSDTLHSGSMIHICYHYFVANYFRPTTLIIPVWYIRTVNVSGKYDLCVVGCDGWRLITWGLQALAPFYVPVSLGSRYRHIVWFITGLLSVEFGFMVACTIASFMDTSFEAIGPSVWMDTVIFAIVTIVDLVLTGSFVTIMRQNMAGFLSWTPQSLALSHTFVYFAIAIPAAKVYSNSVLAVLNCRKSLPRPGINADHSKWGNVELPVFKAGRRALGSEISGNVGDRLGAGQAAALSHLVLDINSENVERKLNGMEIDVAHESSARPPSLMMYFKLLLGLANITSFHLIFVYIEPSLWDDDLGRFGTAWPPLANFEVEH